MQKLLMSVTRGALIAAILALAVASCADPEAATAYRTNPAHTAQATMPDFTLPLVERWDANLGGSVSYPVIANGQAFAITSETTSQNETESSLVALNAFSGVIVWGPISLPGITGAALAYDNGMVFVSTGLPSGAGGVLLAYNAATGSLLWSTDYGTSWDANAPTALNGYVYLQGAGNVTCIRETDGAIVWTVPKLDTDMGAVAVTPASLYVSGGCGQTYSLNPASGNVVWHYNSECFGGYGATPAFYNGDVFIHDVDSNVSWVLDAVTGDSVARTSSYAAAFDDGLMFSEPFGSLVATRMSDWSTVWTQDLGSGAPVTAPVVVNGVVYVATQSSTVTGYDETTGAPVASVGLAEHPSATVDSLVDLAAGDGLILAPAGTHLVAVGGQAPPAPTGLSATPGNNQVSLSWTSSPGATTYNLYKATSPGGEGSTPFAMGLPQPKGIASGFADGTTYYFQVTASNASGESVKSIEVSATPGLVGAGKPPPAPAALTASAGYQQAILSWSATATATSYNVYEGTSAGGEAGTPVAVGLTGTNEAVGGLTNGTSYYFDVTAVNAHGESSRSNEVEATPTLPVGPTGLTASAGINQVTLAWNAVPGSVIYNVYEGTSAGGESAAPVAMGLSLNSATVGGLVNGVTYYFEVTALYSSAIESSRSTEVSATPEAGPPPTPPPAAEDATSYRSNPAHTAQAAMPDMVLPLAEKWKVDLDGNVSSTYPLVAGGYVFAISEDELLGTDYELYALNAGTGAVAWGPVPLDYDALGAMAYDNGQVFVASSQEYPALGGLMNAYDAATGAVLWTTAYGDAQWENDAPTALNGYVYVQNGGSVYAIRESDGAVIWSTSQLDTDDGAVAATPTGLYVCGENGQTYSLDPSTGDVLWQYNPNYGFAGGYTPAYFDGDVFIQDYASSYGTVPESAVIDAATGTLVEQLPNAGTSAFDDGMMFSVSGDYIIATDISNGAIPWKTYIGEGNPVTNPVVVNGVVYVDTDSGALVGVDELTGNVLVDLPLSLNPPSSSALLFDITVGDGIIVVPDGDSLVAVGGLFAAPPADLSATPGDGQVVLSWNSSPGATSYNVYEATSSGAEGSTAYATGLTQDSDTITGLSNGVTYYFEVTAVNQGGEGEKSNEVGATPSASPATSPPRAPAALTATAGDSQVSLSWGASAGATGYNVYEVTSPGGESFGAAGTWRDSVSGAIKPKDKRTAALPHSGAESGMPIAAGLTATDTTVAGLTNGTSYYFTVSAINAAGTSPKSNEVSATPSPPPSPTGLIATSGINQIILNWNALPGAVSYNVYEGTSAGAESGTPVAAGLTSTTYTASYLTNGVTYYFVVNAFFSTSVSGQSNEVSSTPEAGLVPPPPPASEDATAYRFNPAHTAQATLPELSLPLQTKWDVDLMRDVSDPLIAGGRVFTVAGGNNLYALNAGTGVVVWGPVSLPGDGGSLAYDNGTVFVATAEQINEAGVVQAYDASTGALLWTTPTVGYVPGPPTALNGFVYVENGSDVICLRESDGGVVWNTAGIATGSSALVVTTSGIYSTGACGQSDDLDPSTGDVLWQFTATCNYGSGDTPAYYDGDLFISGYSTNSTQGIWAALNGGTGALVQPLQSSGAPAFDNGIMFAISNGLIATDIMNWSNPWAANLGENFPSTPPAIVNGIVYVGTYSGSLVGYDELTGNVLTQLSLGGTELSTGDQPEDIEAGDGIIVVFDGSHLIAVGGQYAPAPTDLTATPGNGQVTLSWNSLPGATSYNIYEGTSSGAEGGTPAAFEVTQTSETLTGLTDGTTYYFEVTAVDANGEGDRSNEASATPSTLATGSPPAVPNALTATAGNQQASISWSASAGASSYNVYMGTSSGGEAAGPVATEITATSDAITGLTNGVTYYVEVTAVNSFGESARSNEASATPAPPAGPAELTATGGINQVTLAWNALPGAVSYNVYEGTSAGAESPTPIQQGLAQTGATVPELINGVTYYFVVTAFYKTSESGLSNEVSATPEPGSVPSPPPASEDATAYRMNPAHTSQVTMPDFAAPVSEIWDVNVGDYNLSNPIIAAGMVFVAYPVNDGAVLSAYSVATGALVWGPIALPNVTGSEIWSSPTYENGRLFLSGGGTSADEGIMIAVNATNGVILWSTDLPGENFVSSSPTALNGLVYTVDTTPGGQSGTLYAVRESDGTVVWTEPVASGGYSSPTVTSGGVYVGYPCGQAYDFDPATGSQIWGLGMACDDLVGDTTASYYDDTLFIHDYGATSPASAAALNPETGAVIRTLPELGAPVFDGDEMFGLSNGALEAISLNNGNDLWGAANNNSDLYLYETTPIAVNGVLYAGESPTNLLRGYDESTGAVVATIPLGDNAGIFNSDETYVVAGDGIILAALGTDLVAVGSSTFDPPGNLSATAGFESATLNWTASSGATSYEIYRGTGSGDEWPYPVENTGSTSFSDSGLTNGVTYYYNVAAVGASGTSAWSNEASATPSASFGISYPQGVQMFSVPYTYPDTSLQDLFGYDSISLFIWAPAGLDYISTPTAPADQIALGQGYWVRFPHPVSLPIGQPAPAGQSVDILLGSGWNMIGDPFTTSVPISSLTFGGGSETFAQASTGSSPLIGPTIWAYSSSSGKYATATSLDAQQGYWIFAYQETDVNVPSP